jgi:hypothetical protein
MYSVMVVTMKDRSNRPLAALGFGGRKSLKRHLRLQQEQEEERQLNSIGDDDEDENLPSPHPKRQRFGSSGREHWVAHADSDIDDLLHVLNDHTGVLNTWELDFLESVKGFVANKGGLTIRQYETLQNIAEKHG